MKQTRILPLIFVAVILAIAVFSVATNFYELQSGGRSVKEYISDYETLESSGVTYKHLEDSSEDLKIRAKALYEEALGYKELAILRRQYEKIPITVLVPQEPKTTVVPPTLTEPIDVYISNTQLEKDLSPYIKQVAEAHSLEYYFIKAIINKESEWNPSSVSKCGAVGIIQLMHHTAEDANDKGAQLNKILKPEDLGVSYTGCPGGTAPYGLKLIEYKQGKSLEQLQAVDDRFDPEKVIEAAAIYFEKVIIPRMEEKEIPITIENLAALYQAGPYGNKSGTAAYELEHNGIIPQGINAYSYSQDVKGFYDELKKKASSRLVASCPGFPNTFLPINQDNKVKCTDKVCCAHPKIVAKLEETKKFIDPGEELLITDAARTAKNQRSSFLDYLAGGAKACGPTKLNIPELRLRVNPNSNDADSAEEWLKINDPLKLGIINTLSNYGHCNHIEGYALDIRLQTMPSVGNVPEDKDIIALRNLMCEAGWANIGEEWWHFEYLTPDYERAKRAGKCYSGTDEYAKAAATVTPGYT